MSKVYKTTFTEAGATKVRVVTKYTQGPPGISAYQEALDNGFTGSREEWLQSLTAYGIALDNGFVGTEQHWLNSLKVDLEINQDTKDLLLTNDGETTAWDSLDNKLNTQKISWDLGTI